MAIEFARMEYVRRSKGSNACRKGAYNSRSKIEDELRGVVYDFSSRVDNIYHEIMLPEHVERKFKNSDVLMNEVERAETKVNGEIKANSQLLKEYVLALPDEKNVSLELKIEMIYAFIEEMKFVKNGVGVQIDIHEPDEQDKNWHAHLLVSTRRFNAKGDGFEKKKARDLDLQVRGGKNYFVCEKDGIGKIWTAIQNRIFEKYDMDNRVDATGVIGQEHIGPVRMRSIINNALERNEARFAAHVENISDVRGVLRSITRTKSIFTIKDIERVVCDIKDEDERRELIEKTLASKELVKLFKHSVAANDNEDKGSYFEETGYFTTRKVRQEEDRIVRIAGKIGGIDNYSKSAQIAKSISKYEGLSSLQQEGINYLLLSDGGIRIMRGRAGSGKSHLLGSLNQIATKWGQEVIGLAPTHKAKLELQGKGFNHTDTIKGFLFGVRNGKIPARTRATIIVDEAGMVANSDLAELFKYAYAYKCNVILAGDERQLASVSRGGMFEYLADRYGSFELDEIKRQAKSWGKEMASCFAKGNTDEGIDILGENQGIISAVDEEESLLKLISDWDKSGYEIGERLIVTVRNRDAEKINEAIRGLLKEKGFLRGREYALTSKELVGDEYLTIKRGFMAGDRVLFSKSDKRIGMISGQHATIISVSEVEFVFKPDGPEEVIRCAADELGGLKHAYAVTIFKSQGATIKDVYVFHNGAGNCRSTYVGLTRHVEEVKLYYNKEATRSIEQLKKQLGRGVDKGISLDYLTKEQVEAYGNSHNQEQTILRKIGTWFKDAAANISDRIGDSLDDGEYYRFDKAVVGMAKVEEVLELAYKEIEAASVKIGYGQEVGKIAIGDSMARLTPKQKFYGKVDGSKGGCSKGEYRVDEIEKSSGEVKDDNKHNNRDNNRARREIGDYKDELETLKSELRFKAEQVVGDILGERNKRLSNSNSWRYGKQGSLAVRVGGAKAGTWYDFEQGIGGDLIKLVEHQTNKSFKESVEYLKDLAGISRKANLKLVYDNELARKYQKSKLEEEKEKRREASIVKRVSELYKKAKPISDKTVAAEYLRKHRGINNSSAADIRTIGIWDRKTAKKYPALIGFARDKESKVTGGQVILLDPESKSKAEVEVVKRSFGKIGGSFVEIQAFGNCDKACPEENITFIAEGIETALSIKEARLEGKILCSLGVGNIRNYQPAKSERIIICADNDGKSASSAKTVIEAAKSLENEGAIVQIVKPVSKPGVLADSHIKYDFNDLLKEEGKEAVQETLTIAINKFNTKSLPEFILTKEQWNPPSEEVKEGLEIVSKYNFAAKSVLGAYKQNSFKGEKLLLETSKNIKYAEELLSKQSELMSEIKHLTPSFNQAREELVEQIVSCESPRKMEDVAIITKYRDQILKDNEAHYVKSNLKILAQNRLSAKDLNEAIELAGKEQVFLASLYGSLKHHDANAKDPQMREILKHAEYAYKTNEKGVGLEAAIKHAMSDKIASPNYILRNLLSANDTEGVYNLHKDLLKYSQSRQLDRLKQNIAKFDTYDNTPIEINGHKFDCPIKYLEHEVAHPSYKFISRPVLAKFLEEQKHLALEKEQHLGLGL